MLKLFRYLKKSIPSVILVILLLVVQAVSDLSLPSYTSDIVNIGIQQGGIDTTAPEVIRQSEMEKLLLFLNPEDQQTVMDSYRPDEELSDKEIKRLRKQYPAAADMPVYVRRELKEDALAELETIMSGPLLVSAASRAIMRRCRRSRNRCLPVCRAAVPMICLRYWRRCRKNRRHRWCRLFRSSWRQCRRAFWSKAPFRLSRRNM